MGLVAPCRLDIVAIMGLVYDEAKRQATLDARGLDFADADAIFEGPSFTVSDARRVYAEERFITYGVMRGAK